MLYFQRRDIIESTCLSAATAGIFYAVTNQFDVRGVVVLYRFFWLNNKLQYAIWMSVCMHKTESERFTMTFK